MLLDHLGVAYDPALLANEKTHMADLKNPSDNQILVTNRASSHASVTTISRHREQLAVVVSRTDTCRRRLAPNATCR